MVDKDTALRLIKDKPWHHSFEIIPGVHTVGAYDPKGLWDELKLPENMEGMSLADIGASNGYFSFEARRRGAKVTAFDFRHKDNSGFGLAQYINGLDDILHYHVNVLDISAEEYGTFDIVLALGLLYHVADPYRALVNCASLSNDRLIIESYCTDSKVGNQLSKLPIMMFIPDAERFPEQGQPNTDRSNFWGFTSTCLYKMVEDIGFSVTRYRVKNDRVLIDAKRASVDPSHTRLHVAYSIIPHCPIDGDPNKPESWHIF
jgi:tRNA (mo5U34)-methyltransferase